VPHTRPPERTVLRGLDLATGRQLWTVEERGSVFVVPVAGDSTRLVMLAADRLALLAADTGAVVRARTLPRFAYGDVSYPEVVGGLLLLRHDLADSGGGTATAFALDTFEQRWQVREPVANGDTGTCEGLPCEPEPGGLAVLDPRSGAARWHTDKYVNLIVRGPDALEVQGVSNHPLSVLDPDTGAVRVDLAGWQYVATSIGQAPMMFFRNEPDSGSIGFGVWSPGARYVRSLGRSSTPVRDCWNDERFVACRVDDGVEVWSYRA
jgi:hypothetical protein